VVGYNCFVLAIVGRRQRQNNGIATNAVMYIVGTYMLHRTRVDNWSKTRIPISLGINGKGRIIYVCRATMLSWNKLNLGWVFSYYVESDHTETDRRVARACVALRREQIFQKTISCFACCSMSHSLDNDRSPIKNGCRKTRRHETCSNQNTKINISNISAFMRCPIRREQ